MSDFKGYGGGSGRRFNGDKNGEHRPHRESDPQSRRDGEFSANQENVEKHDRHSDIITGRNAVTEALKSGRPVESLLVARSTDSSGRSFGQIIALARELNVTVKEVSPAKLEAMCGGSHQGIAALTAVHEYAEIDDIFALAESRGEAPFVILCDGIEDPHNLGAIIRTAEAAGAHGVIIPKRRAVGLTWAVGKASAGALEYIPMARVANLSACIDDLKKRGLWIYCADMDGQPWCQGDLTGATGLVIGGEDSGVSRLVKEKCDGVLSLLMRGSINSLNASVACAIVIYEITRQRCGIKAFGKAGD